MNNNIIDPRQGQLNDPYAALGAKLNKSGVFLNFSKGEYVYGPDKEALPIGKLVVINVPGAQLGWKRWAGGKPVQERMELVRDMRPVEQRDDLGDDDPAMWEIDSQSKPRDPWVMTYTVGMGDPEAGEEYSFSTSSEGGKKAIGKLLTEYSREVRMRPNMLPIVKLDRDSYMHSNKEFGKVYNPILTIVGWTDENSPSIGGRTAHYNEEPIHDRRSVENFANPTQGSRAHTQNAGSSNREEASSAAMGVSMRSHSDREAGEEDDDIPFDVLESPVTRRAVVSPAGRDAMREVAGKPPSRGTRF